MLFSAQVYRRLDLNLFFNQIEDTIHIFHV